jgi:alpha-ribazole phosphatase
VSLILLRHGRPVGGEGLCYGRRDLAPGPDLPELAVSLAAELPGFRTVATSPLARSRRLAERLAAARGLAAPAVDARLAEMDFGAWEGLAWERVPRRELDAWAADLMRARPHGGESVAMLEARVTAALLQWRGAAGPVLIVTHAGVIRAARAIAGEPEAWRSTIAFGGWLRWP